MDNEVKFDLSNLSKEEQKCRDLAIRMMKCFSTWHSYNIECKIDQLALTRSYNEVLELLMGYGWKDRYDSWCEFAKLEIHSPEELEIQLAIRGF